MIEDLLRLMSALRHPEHGCPWDREQSFETIAPYTIEEAYEVADAIEQGDLEALKGELGDLLFQVVFHARMAEEIGAFDFAAVVAAVCGKMERRHPHVFADAEVVDAQAQAQAWETHKRRERDALGDSSALAGVGRALPEWLRAMKLHQRAARVGFDWPDAQAVWDKVLEESAELQQAMAAKDTAASEEELGDLLFAIIALARHIAIDPGRALRRANAKFESRFRAMEQLAKRDGVALAEAGAKQLDQWWEAVKAAQG